MIEIFKKTNVDLSVSGPVELGVIQNNCLVPFIVFHAKQKNIAPYSYVGFSVGANSPSYNDWIVAEDLGELILGNCNFYPGERSGKKAFSANDTVYLNVLGAAQGDFIVDVYGYGFNI